MKTAIQLLLLISCSLLNAQDYHRLIEPDRYLDVGSYEMGHICGYSETHPPLRNMYAGDTIIDGLTYSKLIKYEMTPVGDPFPMCAPFVIDTVAQPQLFFIREDSLNQKVFKLHVGETEEELLFDYSLEQGDFLSGGLEIDTIIEITSLDGVTRKKFYTVPYPEESGYYIEGLGGNRGLFQPPIENFEGQEFTMCIQLNNELVWGSECFNFVTNVESHDMNKARISLFPNPCQNEAMLQLPTSGEGWSYRILNQLGKEMKSGSLINSLQKINISEYPNGLYFVQVVSSDKIEQTMKLIKTAAHKL